MTKRVRKIRKKKWKLSFIPMIICFSIAIPAWAGNSAQAAEGIGKVRVKIGTDGFDEAGKPIITAETAGGKYEVEDMTLLTSSGEEESATGPGITVKELPGQGRTEEQEKEQEERKQEERKQGSKESGKDGETEQGKEQEKEPEKERDRDQDREQSKDQDKITLPSYEIALCAADNFFFKTMAQNDIKITGIGGVCTKAVRRSNGTELLLTVMVTGAARLVGEVERAAFSSPCRASWSAAPNASGYEILLYRGAKRIGFPHRTEGTEYDLAPLMREEGSYSYKIYPLALNKKKGKPAMSGISVVSGETASSNRERFPESQEAGACEGRIAEKLPAWREDEGRKDICTQTECIRKIRICSSYYRSAQIIRMPTKIFPTCL